MNIGALIVFVIVFVTVAALGFLAARWRSGDLSRLLEWGLAGRRFGTTVSWFMLGGDIYTAYSFVAVPALIFYKRGLRVFPVPPLALAFPTFYPFPTRLWHHPPQRRPLAPPHFVQRRLCYSSAA